MNTTDHNYFESLVYGSNFAILDIETTGFSPKYHDKIVEIAIISIDINGKIIDTYETLINPDRDVSATHIHGITADMVKDAPRIEDVIDDILDRINNKTIVGHNIEFDLRFINHEVQRLKKQEIRLKGLCTLQLSRLIVPDVPARKLEDFCEYFDIKNPENHSAYGDCYSTMELFNIFRTTLLDSMSMDEFNHRFCSPSKINIELHLQTTTYKRSDASNLKQYESTRLSQMISRLPTNPKESIPVQNYLNILDDILADRIITNSEFEKLQDYIIEIEISREQVIDIHNEYVRKLTRVYLLDNIISESEQKDLELVCKLLSVEKNNLKKIIEFEKAKIAKQKISDNLGNHNNTDCIGKSVCFTGQLNSKLDGNIIDRTKAQQIALEHGLIIKSGVSCNLDYLVTADPNSLSGKAKKARANGVKIIAEPVFWNMIGLAVE
ncbi:MAG TPA: exonuclease domain-containing protein [Williamwhitmania sp.]|nr:exonuclease domain-containing protein [Williamwhitmania sp.]